MHIEESENIIKIVKRHPTPFVIRCFEALLVVIPVYIALFLIAREFGPRALIISLSIFTFLFFIGFLVASLDYLLDKLIITNKRVVWVDWKSLLRKVENELQLSDIQNVKTSAKGVLSNFYIFRFGNLEIESAASQTSIIFRQCNDPEQIKHIMLNAVGEMKRLNKKPLLAATE